MSASEPHKESLLRFGVMFNLKYLGSVQILCSMRELQFHERRKLTRECIKEVMSKCVSGGNRSPIPQFTELVMKGMVSPNLDRFLSGIDVLLTVSVEMLKIARKDTRQIIFNHKMELVSFASGGEGATSDCIAYVAKDEKNRRACYVLQSMTGHESMIISTIGQAFDLKYSDSLKQTNGAGGGQGSDSDARPSSAAFKENMNSADENGLSANGGGHESYSKPQSHSNFVQPIIRHPIPVRPNELNSGSQIFSPIKRLSAAENLDSELWFHGKISRSQAEELLRKDGDFLVRECSQIPGQYVLSGRYANQPRHLLLVDPEGVVRTRGRRFDSISHLIYHHQQKSISIVSPDSELLLVNPIIRSRRS